MALCITVARGQHDPGLPRFPCGCLVAQVLLIHFWMSTLGFFCSSCYCFSIISGICSWKQISHSLSANANVESIEWVCAYFKVIIESKHLFFLNARNQNLIKCKSIQCLLWACSLQTVKKNKNALSAVHSNINIFNFHPLNPLSLLKSVSFWTCGEELVKKEKPVHVKPTPHVR